MQSFSAIIDKFGCPELARLLGKPYQTVASWKLRDVLPARFWEKVVAEAEKRNLTGVDLSVLAEIEAKRIRPKRIGIRNVVEHAAP